MIKMVNSFLVLVIVLFQSAAMASGKSESKSASKSEAKGFNFFVAAGPNLVFPTSVRVGWDQWEIGLLTRNFWGFNKTFSVSGGATYASFGLGVNSDPFPTNLGLQGAVGCHYDLFWHIGLRAEMLANANFNGSTMSHALLGVSYGF